MSKFPDLFFDVDFDDNAPLVIIHKSGWGRFSKFSSRNLYAVGLKEGMKTMLYFDPKSNLTSNSNDSSKFKEYLIELIYYDNYFYFKSKHIIKGLKLRRELEYYLASMKIYPIAYLYKGQWIILWKLYDTSRLSLNLRMIPNQKNINMDRVIEVRNKLISFLKINESIFNEWIFESAIEFLENHFNLNNWASHKLTLYKPFWTWWQHQYYIEDEKILKNFIEDADLQHSSINTIRNMYKYIHVNNPKKLDSHLYNYIYLRMKKEEVKHPDKSWMKIE